MMEKIINKPAETERIDNVGKKLAASTSEDAMMECRSCLAGVQEDACVDVFCAWNPPWPGMGLSIAEDLAKLAGIQICVSDPYSKIICKTCCIKLQNAISFMVIVQNSDVLLRKRLKQNFTEASSWPKPIQIDKNITNDALQNMEIEIENIKQEVASEDEFDNNVACNDTTDARLETLDIKIEPEEMTQQHISIDINNSIKQPLEENQTSTPNGDAVTHGRSEEMLQNMKEEPLTDDEMDADPDIEKDCMLCTKAFHTVRGLKAHVIAVHSYDSVRTPPKPPVHRTHKCPICNKFFETQTDLLVHETCHSKFTCYVCEKKFNNFQQLRKHRTKQCKKRSVLPRLKTLDDVRRIAEHGGTKTLQIFDMQIPISRIREMQIIEKDPDVTYEKGHIQKTGGKGENDVLSNIFNDKVMSVIVNVRLPCENNVQPKKEQNYDNGIIPKEEIDDIEMLIPNIELIEEPEFNKKSAPRSKRKKQSKSVEPSHTLPTDPPGEITDQETSPSKLPEETIEQQSFEESKALEVNCLKKLKKKRKQQSENQDFDEAITASKILKEEEKENSDKEDQERIDRMENNGIGWTVIDGRVVANKKVDPLYPCRKKCNLNIPEEFRQRFFDYFWSINYKQQQNFAASLIKCKVLYKIPGTMGVGQRDRKCTFSYRLRLNKEDYDICKGCLIQTIGVHSNSYLINICNKALKKKMKVTTANKKRNRKKIKSLESPKIISLVAASNTGNQKVQNLTP